MWRCTKISILMIRVRVFTQLYGKSLVLLYMTHWLEVKQTQMSLAIESKLFLNGMTSPLGSQKLLSRYIFQTVSKFKPQHIKKFRIKVSKYSGSLHELNEHPGQAPRWYHTGAVLNTDKKWGWKNEYEKWFAISKIDCKK